MSNSAIVYYGNIPSLWDRAGGIIAQGGNPNGTPSIPASGIKTILMNYAQGGINLGTVIFEELPDSPVIEAAEQWTITHKYQVDWTTGQNLQRMYYRGSIMYDSTGNTSRVLSTTLQPLQKGDARVALLTMVTEGTSWGNPPDEFSVSVIQLNPVAEKHPRYACLNYQQRNIIRNITYVDYTAQQQIFSTINSPSFMTSSVNGISYQTIQSASMELALKKVKGEETFYLSAYQVQYSRYFWLTQDINPGGYIQDPFLSGAVPAYFWTDPNGNNILYQNAQFNQNLFPNYGSLTTPPFGLSWLRQTDSSVLNRTWFKLTNTWIGAPLGNWDNEWYSTTLQPYQASITQGGINVIN